MPPKRKKAHKRKKETSGPMTAAGLVRFFDDVDAKVRISPYVVVWLAIGFAALVAGLSYVFAVFLP